MIKKDEYAIFQTLSGDIGIKDSFDETVIISSKDRHAFIEDYVRIALSQDGVDPNTHFEDL